MDIPAAAPDHDRLLSGKLAVITGGTRGIGLAIATRFTEAGARVVIAGRGLESLEQAVRRLNEGGEVCLGVQADLSTREGVDAVVDAATSWGGFDILVNNVGGAPAGKFTELTDEQFMQAWSLKLLAGIRLTRAAIPQMSARGGGAIINVIGLGGREPSSEATAIGTTNAAIRALTKGLARELAAKGIRINAISPSHVRTERATLLAEQTAAARGVPVEDVRRESLRAIPTARFVEPSEVAEVALFLASDRAPSITGAEIVIDGGESHYM